MKGDPIFRLRIGLVVAFLALAACSEATTDSTTTSVATTSTSTTSTSTIPDLREDLEVAEQTIAELQAELEALEDELSESEQARSDAEQASSDAEAARDEALAELDELRLAYDDEIQQVLADGVSAVVDSACSAIDEPLDDAQVAELIDRQISDWSEQPGLPEDASDVLDREAIEEQVAACVAAAEEQARQAQLTEPKGDGFYTVGEEIAPGTWESQGTGSSCYWARLDANQELLDNHFGNAGGRITIRSSDTEVEFSSCGTWEYQG